MVWEIWSELFWKLLGATLTKTPGDAILPFEVRMFRVDEGFVWLAYFQKSDPGRLQEIGSNQKRFLDLSLAFQLPIYLEPGGLVT